MRKEIMFLIIALVFIETTLAQITISPNEIQVDNILNQQKSYSFNLTNNYNFVLRSFQFSNLSEFTFPSILINPNETIKVNFTVNSNTIQQKDINSLVTFNYIVDVPSQPEIHLINIGTNGFSPNFLVVHQDDTITWKNIDTISHTVTSSFFDQTLTPNQTFSKTFNDVQTINYQDNILFLGGTINVLNKSNNQEVHNPNYDKNLLIHLTVTANPTTLQLENIDNSSITIQADGKIEGLMRVKNNGTEKAYFIKISSDNSWVDFDVTNFDLDIGEQKYVKYTISPFIIETNQTDKTYNIKLTSKASNSNEAKIDLSLYIPYRDIDSDLSNPARLGDILTRFCKEYPEACIPSNGSNSSQIIIRDPEIKGNLTWSQFLDIFRRTQSIEDTVSRLGNQFSLAQDETNAKDPIRDKMLNDTLSKLETMDKRMQTNYNVIWILGFFVLIFAGIIFMFYKFRKFNNKKKIVEGYM